MARTTRQVWSRRTVLAALLAGAASPGLAQFPSPRPEPRPSTRAAEREIARVLSKSGVTGKVGFALADARTGEILESHLPDTVLPPASVTKAVTALYALEKLGPGFRFQTRLVATGPVENGQIAGDLVLVGSGDPTLDTDVLGDLARDLKAAGIHGVKGRFRVHAGALPSIPEIDTKQPDHVGYNPGVSGLNLNYNRVHFEWKRVSGGYSVAMDARTERYRPEVAVSRMRVVDRAAPVYTYDEKGGVDTWTVARAALGDGGARWLPVRHPELYAADVFRTLARAHGIVLSEAAVSKGAVPEGQVVAAHQSPELRYILEDMLRYSTNLTAEAVGLTASHAGGGRPGSLALSAGAMSRWLKAQHGVQKASFVDHSGLGDRSRLTATDMVQALVAVGPEGPLRPILKNIPLKLEKGKPAPRGLEIRAKTGTLNFVSSLAGYVTLPSGRELAFAIFAADQGRRAQIAPGDRERPVGARSWVQRARRLQHQLIARWATRYG